ncbi:monovalent cation/H+ antiporter subunit A [Schlegelella aquatica]|uniref:monovalent cation/H+ antiporter subunit A n=1 Tax=Caldimonas aquatica TaxID=376175 RepID=UPI0037516C5B
MGLLSSIVCLPLILGTLACAWIGGRNTPARRGAAAGVAAAVTLAALALLIALGGSVFDGEVRVERTSWVPALGLNLGFRLDGLALMFAGLITAMGLLIVAYAAFYLHEDDPAGKFYGLLMLFMGAMLGIVLADNLLLLVVFWELTSISSFLLVGYWGHREDARAGARTALTVTGGGGLALLAGVVLLGQIAGTYELSELLGRGEAVRADPRFGVALVLILLGCFTKSAQWPFHFWLPEAMAAPTPVSAYLHSATMVKAGLFLLARLYPVLGPSPAFELIVGSVGLLTMTLAAFIAIFRHDLKGLLAYSTISHLGLITFLIGLASPMSAVAAVFHILNHASFKAALFMAAGIVDHETGTRDMRRLGGLMRLMPWVGTIALLGAATMAGVPLFNGFVSKEMMLDEAVQSRLWGTLSWAVPLLATLASLFSVAYSLRFAHDTFFNGPPRDIPQAHPHEPPLGMKLPAMLLIVISIAVGLMPALIAGPLVELAAGAVLGAPAPEHHLALWHGFTWPLLMSVIALAGGAILYAGLQHRGRLHRYVTKAWGGKASFTALVEGLFRGAGRLTSTLENGSLQRYVAWMLVAAIALGAWPMWQPRAEGLVAGERQLLAAPPVAIIVWAVLIVVGGALVLMHRQRFLAVVLAGAVGLVASLTFLSLSAPDLAMTQLSVDVVSTVLLLMGLALLPQASPRESAGWRRARDGLVALLGGGAVSWLTWLMLTRDHDSISWYFLDQSVPGGGGTNAVNVILVDFRGYDTFGEITVLGIAGVGVLALMEGLRVRRPATDPEGRPWSFSTEPVMLRVVSRLVLPIALVVSAYIFWRGHNLPGGGFIAGLVTAVALVLQYMAVGQARADMLLHAGGGRRFVRWIGTGLGIAALTGIGAFVFGHPFLTSAHGHPSVPILGELPLASAALFDLGVYITVVGSTLLTLSVLAGASKEPASIARSQTQ